MKKILEDHLGGQFEFTVETDGESGEQVTVGFLRRMNHQCKINNYISLYFLFAHLTLNPSPTKPEFLVFRLLLLMSMIDGSNRTREEPYDWVIFLGGTNDIAWGKSIDDIYSSILGITNIPLENGARLLIMTVPECHAKIQRLNDKRDKLNSLIKGDTRDDVFVMDLKEQVPYHAMEVAERRLIWDDGLHFTEKGYERVGTLVAVRLVEILKGETSSK